MQSLQDGEGFVLDRNLALHVQENSKMRAGIPSLTPHRTNSKYKREEFVLNQIPEGEATKASNGKWVCTVCSVVLDCADVLLIHRNGKKHKARVEYLKELAIQKERKKRGGPSSLQPRSVKRKLNSNDQQQSKRLHLDQEREASEQTGDAVAQPEIVVTETPTQEYDWDQYWVWYYYHYPQGHADQTQPEQTPADPTISAMTSETPTPMPTVRPQPQTESKTESPTPTMTREQLETGVTTEAQTLGNTEPHPEPTPTMALPTIQPAFRQLPVSEQRAAFQEQHRQHVQHLTQRQVFSQEQQMTAQQRLAQQYKFQEDKRRQHFIDRLSSEGYLQNEQGQFYRGPDVEWDSDDEDPTPPPSIFIQFVKRTKGKR